MKVLVIKRLLNVVGRGAAIGDKPRVIMITTILKKTPK
jgi:hypothetical protein